MYSSEIIRKYALAFIMFGVLLKPDLCKGAEPHLNSKQDHPQKLRIDEIQHATKRNSDDIEIIRRDQINYRVEKDLLKESYSTSLQGINSTVSISSVVVGLLFAILGFLGIRNIGKIKEDFDTSLKESRKLKDDLESEIETLRKKQIEIEESVGKIIRVNMKQASKIELLELVEKIDELHREKNFRWAMEHVSAAMEIDAEFGPLLVLKGQIEIGLKEYNEAINTYNFLENSTGKISDTSLFNYLELLVLFGDVEKYSQLYYKYRNRIDVGHGGYIHKFFEALLLIRQGNLPKLSAYMLPIIQEANNDGSSRLGNWQLGEAAEFLKLMPVSELKTASEKILKFFVGTETKEAVLEVLR